MDVLVISKENNILHICNKGYTVDYSIYNSKGHLQDGGILESSKDKFDTNIVIKEIINLVNENFEFNEPYMYLRGDRAQTLLELIEMEDYENMKKKINDFQNERNEIEEEIEKEIEK